MCADSLIRRRLEVRGGLGAQVLKRAAVLAAVWAGASAAEPSTGEPEWLVSKVTPGLRGGRLVVALREEPKNLDPLRAQDEASRTVLSALHADLIHIRRDTQEPEVALAREWSRSPDGRRFTVRLRSELRFSDGQPVTADDVVASFEAILDPRTTSPQRGLLILGGEPIKVSKVDRLTVRFDLPLPYAAAERLFDGFAILPASFLKGTSDPQANTPVPGLGPFRVRENRAGERLVLERNPFYWKRDGNGTPLPYLDEVVFLRVAHEEAELVRLRAGELDLVSRLGPASFEVLRREGSPRLRLLDLGPGLETHFLFFNLNAAAPASRPVDPELAARRLRTQGWFRDPRFRRALSAIFDRQALVRLVYQGRATGLSSPVAAGNTLWAKPMPPLPAPRPEAARQLLTEAGFRRQGSGPLVDREGSRVELTVVTNAGNRQREQMAAILIEDLRTLGIEARLAPLEFRSLLDRLFSTYDYEACLLGVVSGDADPNPEIPLWTSQGTSQFWSLSELEPLAPWQQEIDRLMASQLSELDPAERRRQFHRVQELLTEYLPVIPLVSPHVLVAAHAELLNLRPGILPPYALWNLEELFWSNGGGATAR